MLSNECIDMPTSTETHRERPGAGMVDCLKPQTIKGKGPASGRALGIEDAEQLQARTGSLNAWCFEVELSLLVVSCQRNHWYRSTGVPLRHDGD